MKFSYCLLILTLIMNQGCEAQSQVCKCTYFSKIKNTYFFKTKDSIQLSLSKNYDTTVALGINSFNFTIAVFISSANNKKKAAFYDFSSRKLIEYNDKKVIDDLWNEIFGGIEVLKEINTVTSKQEVSNDYLFTIDISEKIKYNYQICYSQFLGITKAPLKGILTNIFFDQINSSRFLKD